MLRSHGSRVHHEGVKYSVECPPEQCLNLRQGGARPSLSALSRGDIGLNLNPNHSPLLNHHPMNRCSHSNVFKRFNNVNPLDLFLSYYGYFMRIGSLFWFTPNFSHIQCLHAPKAKLLLSFSAA